MHLRLENRDSPFTCCGTTGQILRLPIAHGEGCYFADPETLEQLEDSNRIAFRYCDPSGKINPAANPNGSLHHIAGILNQEGNVLGLMPHPERACEARLGGAEGRLIFDSILTALSATP